MPAMDMQRREAGVSGVINAGTGRVQCIHQITNRPLVHAGDPMYGVIATNRCQRCSEGANRRACIAHEQISRRHRQRARSTCDGKVLTLPLLYPAYSQLLECHEHHMGIIRGKQGLDVCCSHCKRCQ